MKKELVVFSLFAGTLFFGPIGISQTGFGTADPIKSAAVEIKSDSRGLLIPRVKLTRSDDFLPLLGNSGQANSLLVFNSQEINDVFPGYYYWSSDLNRWIRLISNSDQATSPWLIQETLTPSVSPDDPIYHTASVAVGKDKAAEGVALDVQGAIRAGTLSVASVGDNSVGMGAEVSASGNYSAAFGFHSKATGEGSFAGGGFLPLDSLTHNRNGGIAEGNGSFAFGYEPKATGEHAVAFGFRTLASDRYAFALGRETRAGGNAAVVFGRNVRADGNYSFAMGRNNDAIGSYSITMGRGLRAKTRSEIVFGTFNNLQISRSAPQTWDKEHPLFVIGNGTDYSKRNNALTLLKSGFLGIGIIDSLSTAKPSEMFDVGSGRVRVRELPQTLGAASDYFVVADKNGILKSITPEDIKSTGPWFKHKTVIPTNQNSDDIFQMGKVAIGKNEAIEGAYLDVVGSIHAGEVYNTGNTKFIGVDAIGVGKQIIASGNYSAAFGYRSEATAEGALAAGGMETMPGGKARGRSSFAFGHSAIAEGAFSVAIGQGTRANSANETVFGRYNQGGNDNVEGWNSNDNLFVIGNGNSSTRRNALTILKSGWMGLGYAEPFSDEKLRVNGSILAANVLFPDYVFESYFSDEASLINPSYNFKPLEEIKEFVQNNHHLPGIPSVKNLRKTEEGAYEFNLSQLSIQSLEKIEELFLYLFEQDKRINQLQEEIDELKNLLFEVQVQPSGIKR